MTRAVIGLTVALVVTSSSAAWAQAPRAATARPFRFTISSGLLWSDGYPIGDSAAEIRRNASGSPPPAFTLFNAASFFRPAPGFEARLGFAISSRFSVEGGLMYSRPRIEVTVSDDVEGANSTFDGETTAQYIVDASVLWKIPGVRRDARLTPFAIAGGGYLRQLHEERTVVETGQVYHLGGGVQYLFGGRNPRRRPFGLRGDVRAYIRRDGIEFEDEVRVFPALSGLVLVGF